MRRICMLGTMLFMFGCGGGDNAEDVAGQPDVQDKLEVATEVGQEDQAGTPDEQEQPDQIAPPDESPQELAKDMSTGEVSEWSKQYGQACPLVDRVGRFGISVEDWGSQVAGEVNDEVYALQDLQTVETHGDCRILSKENPYCDPECEVTTEQCTSNGCTPYPEKVSVGTVVVTGLSEPVEMEPEGATYAKWDFAAPAFESGAQIELTATGGAMPGFALQGEGVALLEVAEPQWFITSGEPLVIEWVPAEGPGTIYIKLNINEHGLGATSARMICEVEDTGSYAISAEAIEALYSYGTSPAETAEIRRRTVDSVQVGDYCVELEVFTPAAVSLKMQ